MESRSNRNPKRAPRIPGICADAEALGVTRIHLWCVLKGRRESASLKRRYAALKTKQAHTS